MAERVKARRLSDEEGQRLLRILRRGEPKAAKSVIRYRRAMVVLASASGNTVPAIARLVAADEDTVREVIHRFNELGMRALDPRWAGGRPRRISAEDEAFLVATATTRPGKLGQPFTHWSLRKLVGYLADNPRRIVRIGRERARRLLAAHELTFQRTKTWKESPDPQREAKLARIEEVIEQHPDRTFAFDEFGPLTIQPVSGVGWAPQGQPHRLPANYHRTAGVRSFHGCYSVGEDRLWGVARAGKSAANTQAALRSLRAARPDGPPSAANALASVVSAIGAGVSPSSEPPRDHTSVSPTRRTSVVKALDAPGGESGSGLASVAKQLALTLAAVTADAPPADDLLHELRIRRDRKLGRLEDRS